jgi:thymidylate synthase (FAD)
MVGATMKVELLSHISSEELKAVVDDDLSGDELLVHLSFTFAVERISRACSHQLVRHRVASYSQQSQRYIPARILGERVVVPPSIHEKNPSLFSAHVKASSDAYKGLIKAGVPREDARFVLPNAAETNLLMTMDGRELMHFFGLRCCNRAQWEIKALADEMLKKVRMVEPGIFSKGGPNCFQLGYCPEGRFTCGEMKKVIEIYAGDGPYT